MNVQLVAAVMVGCGVILHVSIGRVLYKWAYPDDVIKSGESPTLSFSATPTSGTHPCFTEVLPIGYVGIGCYGDVFPGQRVWFHLVQYLD